MINQKGSNMINQTVFIGVTKDNELYFLEYELTERNFPREFSISGFTVSPITYEDAVSRSREYLEDGELWRDAVRAEQTTQGLDDWIEDVLAIDGETSQIDNSLYQEQLDVDGTDYLFESGSCGQHEVEPEDIAYYAINKNQYQYLLELWHKYHLKELPESITVPAFFQDTESEVIKAVQFINNQ